LGAGPMKPTVLIVEPHLEGTAGHPIRYVRALTEAFASGGARVEVLAARRFPKGASVGAPVRRLFRRPIYGTWNPEADLRKKRWKGIARIKWLRSAVWRGLGFYQLLRRLLKAAGLAVGIVLQAPFHLLGVLGTLLFGRDDTFSTLSPFAATLVGAVARAEKHGPVSIVVPTATLGILSEILALPVMHDGPLPRLHLLFHDAPEVWASWYRPTSTEGVAGRLRASGWAPLVHLYATTEAAAERLQTALGPETNVRTVEDIFTPADLDAMHMAGAAPPLKGALAPHETALMEWQADRRAEGLRVAVIPGPLRPDKGALDLPALIAALDFPEGKKFALIVQRSHHPDWLTSYFQNASLHPRVHVVEHELSDTTLHRSMAEADIILLPYRREDYAVRISSVLTEAVLHARPVLVTAGIAMQSTFRNTASCRFVDTWSDWPSAATELIHDMDMDRGALSRSATDFERRLRHRPAWQTLVQDALASAPPVYAKPPMILVRPVWLKSGSARLQDEQLAYFASHGRPILELIVEPVRATRHRSAIVRAILEDRASSPSGVVCFTMSRSGLLPRLAFFARRGATLLRSTYTGQFAEMSRLCPIPSVVMNLARERRVAFALVHHYFRLPFVAPLAKSMPIWLETQDVQAVLQVQHGNVNMVTGKPDPFPRMLADEMRWVRSADAVVAISESELPTFIEHVGAEKVFLCQPPIATALLAGDESAVPPFDILLVASENPGNRASLKWFMAQVWPAVRAAGLNCIVVGSIGGNVRDPQGLQFAGTVERLAPWYASARVVAIPTIEGTGIGIKTIEAMSTGVPIVATTLAYRGLPPEWRKPAPPIDDAADFAEELIRLCRDPRSRKALQKRVRGAYAALELEERFRRQMQAIEAHVLAAGKSRFGGEELNRGRAIPNWQSAQPKQSSQINVHRQLPAGRQRSAGQ
jgi:glycosyltransferase involved in cell wall biosynthesis